MWALVVAISCMDTPYGGIEDLSLSADDPAGSVVTVRWSEDQGGESTVRWGQLGVLDHETPTLSRGVGPQEQHILGAKLGSPVQVQVSVITAQGEELLSEVQTIELPLLPPDFPALYPSGEPLDGWVLTGVVTRDGAWTVILDGEGDPVWVVEMQHTDMAGSIKPSERGGVWVQNSPLEPSELPSTLYRLDARGERVQELLLPSGHHDFAELPGGRVGWMAAVAETMPYEGGTLDITGDALMVWDPDTEQSQPLASVSQLLGELPYVCEHQLSEMDTGGLDWTHSNSLAYVPELDALAVHSSHINTISFVSLGDGALLDTLGQLGAHPLEGPLWSHGHFSQLWDGGMLLFDNGNHKDPPVSSVSGWSWSDAGPLRRDWVVSEPAGHLVTVLGDVDPLPEDRVLITWSSLGAISATTREGEQTWRVDAEIGAGFSRSAYTEDLYGMLEPVR